MTLARTTREIRKWRLECVMRATELEDYLRVVAQLFDSAASSTTNQQDAKREVIPGVGPADSGDIGGDKHFVETDDEPVA